MTVGWTDDGKQLYETIGYFATKKEGLEALAEYHKNPLARDVRDVTLGEIYERWSAKAYETLTKSTANGYRAVWKRLSKLADTPVRSIRTSHLQTVIDEMIEEGLSRSSLEKAKTLSVILLDIAVNDDVIPTNYAKVIKLPKARKAKKDTFTDIEIRKIEEASEHDKWAGTILILIYTGLRVGEMLELTPFAVDTANWTITGGLKTDAGRDRIVPIHTKIQPLIRYWMENRGPRLIHKDGRPISITYYRRSLYYPALRRAGIERHLTPHATRHTFASLLHRANVAPKTAQDLLGHSDYATTANVYTHTRLEDLRRAVEAI